MYGASRRGGGIGKNGRRLAGRLAAMPNTYFILFEIVIYIQFALCLRHAIKHGTASLLKLFSGIAFGVLLELATIRQLNAYQYGQFMLMVLDVPLCIGVAWSCIIYAVMEFSDGSTLPYFTRPVLDGLLALNIDLAMDTIAIRLGLLGNHDPRRACGWR